MPSATARAGSSGVERSFETTRRPSTRATTSVNVPPVSTPTTTGVDVRRRPTRSFRSLTCRSTCRSLGLVARRLVARGLAGRRLARAARVLPRVRARVLAVRLVVAGAALAARAAVVGDVPSAALQLEAGAGDEAADLAPAGRAPCEGGIGDALGVLELSALLALVLVDRHAAAVITGPGPVKPAGAARAPHAQPPAKGPGPAPACPVPWRRTSARGRRNARRGHGPGRSGPPGWPPPRPGALPPGGRGRRRADRPVRRATRPAARGSAGRSRPRRASPNRHPSGRDPSGAAAICCASRCRLPTTKTWRK